MSETPYRTAGVPAPDAGPSDSEVALALAEKLVRTAQWTEAHGAATASAMAALSTEADEARAELTTVTRAVSDLVADEFVRRIVVDPAPVCAASVFSGSVPLWFDSSRDKLVVGLEAQTQHPQAGGMAALLGVMPIRREATENAGAGRRLLSVLSRPWVIGFVWLPAIAATVGAFVVESLDLRLAFLATVAVLFGLAYAVDARLRRCPSCRRLLAAMPVGARHAGTHVERVQVTTPTGPTVLDREVDTYNTLWRCVHCQHRWE